MTIKDQLSTIDPSAKDALFRRLLVDDELSYLRTDNTIIGFEVDLDQPTALVGYTVIAIQKHTILAYRSDLGEPYRLVIFPSMEKIEDPAFSLLNLKVTRAIFDDDRFLGRAQSSGTLQEVAKDLIPPYKAVEISEEMATQMNDAMREDTFTAMKKNTAPAEPSVPEDIPDDDMMEYSEVPTDTPFSDDFSEEPEGFMEEPPEEPENKPKIAPTNAVAQKIADKKFTDLVELQNFMIVKLGAAPDLVSNVVTAAMRSTTDKSLHTDVAVLLFIRLANEGKIKG